MKYYDYCVFDYFLFHLVTISGGELHKVHDCLSFSLRSITISAGESHKLHD